MKIVTLNLRGVGSVAKKKCVKRLIQKEGFDVCFFQETKRREIDVVDVSRMWGGYNFDWIAKSSSGLSGGLLTVWRKGVFEFLFSFSNSDFIGMAVKMDNRIIYLINVYSGCAIRRKRELWSNIISEKARLNPGQWIVGGDFNLVTNRADRRGKNTRFSNVEAQDFRFFMDEMGLVEAPCLGKNMVPAEWCGS